MSKSKKRAAERIRIEANIVSNISRGLLIRYREAMTSVRNIWRNKKIIREIIDCAKKHNIDLSKYRTIEVGSYTITFEFKSFGTLRHTRKLLKLAIPGYKDELRSVYVPYDDTVWITYECVTEGYKQIRVQFITTVDKVPKIYLRNGKCGFKTIINEAQEEYETTSFVCNA